MLLPSTKIFQSDVSLVEIVTSPLGLRDNSQIRGRLSPSVISTEYPTRSGTNPPRTIEGTCPVARKETWKGFPSSTKVAPESAPRARNCPLHRFRS